jgi:hydroxypyruvate isomerase
MTRFAINVGFLYGEVPWGERFDAAASDGFEAVESAWPPEPAAFVAVVRRTGLRVALLNVFAGDLDAGERGHANDPGAMERWRGDFRAALRLAEEVACPTLNILAGNDVPGVDAAAQRACLDANLRWALRLAGASGRTLVVELLNPYDTPAYLAASLQSALAIVEPLAAHGLRLQLDTYHAGRLGLDVAATLRRVAPLVGHVQVADAPGRGEPGTGAIDWPAFFDALAEAGYDGAVGLEYRPAAGTREGLAWLPREARAWSATPWRPPR